MKTQKYTGHIGKKQVGMVLKSAGTNILMTSLISISVFLIAAIVPIPALRAFCLQLAILVIFVLVTTFFGVTSLISFDIRRRRSARIDIFCCFPSEDLQWPFVNNSHSLETASTIDGQMRQLTETSNSPTPTSSNLLLVSCLNFFSIILFKFNYNNYFVLFFIFIRKNLKTRVQIMKKYLSQKKIVVVNGNLKILL